MSIPKKNTVLDCDGWGNNSIIHAEKTVIRLGLRLGKIFSEYLTEVNKLVLEK
jgi:hypothetical protein